MLVLWDSASCRCACSEGFCKLTTISLPTLSAEEAAGAQEIAFVIHDAATIPRATVTDDPLRPGHAVHIAVFGSGAFFKAKGTVRLACNCHT